jgi:hypothetical protein
MRHKHSATRVVSKHSEELLFYDAPSVSNFKRPTICEVKVKVKWFRYMPGVAQRLGRGITLLFHDRGPRRGWVVSSTPRLYFTPGKDPVPILQEAGWAPGPVWTGAENLAPPGLDPRIVQPVAQSLYRLSYPAQIWKTRILIMANRSEPLNHVLLDYLLLSVGLSCRVLSECLLMFLKP